MDNKDYATMHRISELERAAELRGWRAGVQAAEKKARQFQRAERQHKFQELARGIADAIAALEPPTASKTPKTSPRY